MGVLSTSQGGVAGCLFVFNLFAFRWLTTTYEQPTASQEWYLVVVVVTTHHSFVLAVRSRSR